MGVSMSIFGDICHAYSGGKSTPTPIQTTTNYSSTRLPMLWRRNPDAVPDLFKQYESSLLVHEFHETNKVMFVGMGVGEVREEKGYERMWDGRRASLPCCRDATLILCQIYLNNMGYFACI